MTRGKRAVIAGSVLAFAGVLAVACGEGSDQPANVFCVYDRGGAFPGRCPTPCEQRCQRLEREECPAENCADACTAEQAMLSEGCLRETYELWSCLATREVTVDCERDPPALNPLPGDCVEEVSGVEQACAGEPAPRDAGRSNAMSDGAPPAADERDASG